MEIRQRNIGVAILLTILTCGIYGIYWFIVLSNDVKAASKDSTLATGGVAFLLTLLTCGIYGIYWAYRMGKAVAMAQKNVGMPATDNSILYLVLQVIGLALVNYALIQNEINTISNAKQEQA